MRAGVSDCGKNVPVTVKCRIGVDNQDDDTALFAFAQCMVEAGVEVLIVHARKAWLQGLSPKQNREVPPLNYARVYRLKREFPSLNVVINGGIDGLPAVREHLAHVDGVLEAGPSERGKHLYQRHDFQWIKFQQRLHA